MQAHAHWDPDQFQVSPLEGHVRFHDLNLPDELMHAIYDLNFQYCTPIQGQILESTLSGKDATGQAQTGTGKTAAFLITIFTRLLQSQTKSISAAPKVLILAPTRELVIQIAEEAEKLGKYCPFNVVSVFGGMDYQKQKRKLTQNRVDIVVATPGRLIDFLSHQDIRLDKVEILVIDEADRMLDMGFIPQVRRIVRATPHKNNRQTLLFSATLSPEVVRLSEQWTQSPVSVEIEPEQVEVQSVEQIVYLTTTREKKALLYNIIIRNDLHRVLIFCNRKDETRYLADLMQRYQLNCAILSGDVAQHKRLRVLNDFRDGKIRVLIATDVAARGLHIEGISHVINYTLPRDPENYVHRIGRTGRAGATGTSISFACEEDSFWIPEIEAYLGHPLPCSHPEEKMLVLPRPPKPKSSTSRKRPRRRSRPRKKSRPKRAQTNGESKP